MLHRQRPARHAASSRARPRSAPPRSSRAPPPSSPSRRKRSPPASRRHRARRHAHERDRAADSEATSTRCARSGGRASRFGSMASETLGALAQAAASLRTFHPLLLARRLLPQGASSSSARAGAAAARPRRARASSPPPSAPSSARPRHQTVNTAIAAGVAPPARRSSFGAPVDPALLAHADAAAVVPVLPVMVLVTYHNVVPTITYQLGCDLAKVRTAVIAGSALPLLLFVLYGIVLGSVPFDVPSPPRLSPTARPDPSRSAPKAARRRHHRALFDPRDPVLGRRLHFWTRRLLRRSPRRARVSRRRRRRRRRRRLEGFFGRSPPRRTRRSGGRRRRRRRRRRSGRATARCARALRARAAAGRRRAKRKDAASSSRRSAGTYGILTLFGILPAAMSWRSATVTTPRPLSTRPPHGRPVSAPPAAPPPPPSR